MYEQNSNFYRTQEVCPGTSENEMITADETSGFFDEFNYMTCKKSPDHKAPMIANYQP
jgi:hypothetical protein